MIKSFKIGIRLLFSLCCMRHSSWHYKLIMSIFYLYLKKQTKIRFNIQCFYFEKWHKRCSRSRGRVLTVKLVIRVHSKRRECLSIDGALSYSKETAWSLNVCQISNKALQWKKYHDNANIYFSVLKLAVGSRQARPNERATERPEVSLWRRVLEAADFLCQWYAGVRL